MRIRYAINARIPTPRAHGFQVMKTCEALAKAGAEVELVVPSRRNVIETDPFEYYGTEKLFKITYLPTIDLVWTGIPYAFSLQTLLYTFHLARYVRRNPDGSVLYVRGELGWLLPLVSKLRFFWETHIPPKTRRAQERALAHADGTIVITEAYKQELVRDYGVSKNAVLVSPDGVDLHAFGNLPSKEEARKKLGLAPDKKIAIYVGSDAPWKGARYLREAAVLLPDNYQVAYVGLTEPKGDTKNQYFAGMRPFPEVPLWNAAADVGVVTGDPAYETAQRYTSPLKLVEYMAAKLPIVAPDLPSFRELVSEESAVLVRPGDAKALADGIVRAVEDENKEARAAAAGKAVEPHSWAKRAERLLAFIQTHA